jgi:pyrimidine deaminase RibD-like protein
LTRSETLEFFLLGFGLDVPNEGYGRPTNITQLQIAAKEKCADCSREELLDALYNLPAVHAELIKFVARPAREFQRVSFKRIRRTRKWSDFFSDGQFNIKTLPLGRRRFEELTATVIRDNDRRFAELAIAEARKSVPEQDGRPHPKVGAVVVKDGKILSVAHRGEEPGNHAEYFALEKKLSDEAVAGSTVYATLEPCTTRNHPKIPCAERLVERKVARVVIGMLDPDDRISGRGQRRLRKAGIVTDFFPPDLMREVEEMNREFIRFCEQPKNAQSPPAPKTVNKTKELRDILHSFAMGNSPNEKGENRILVRWKPKFHKTEESEDGLSGTYTQNHSAVLFTIEELIATGASELAVDLGASEVEKLKQQVPALHNRIVSTRALIAPNL